jgi:hypothetical protein
MAMARPVVAAEPCVEALDVVPGRDLLAADSAESYAAAIGGLLVQSDRALAMGRAGRQQVLDHYGWSARLAALDGCLDAAAVDLRQAA